MRIMKIEALIDVSDEIVTTGVISELISRVFEDNDHLAKLIICEVNEPIETIQKKQHEWRWYMNGTFCTKCNQAIGTDRECI